MSGKLKDEWINTLFECRVGEPMQGHTNMYLAPRVLELWQMTLNMDDHSIVRAIVNEKIVLNIPKKKDKFYF